jgi:tripartite-type tricarboxylate transporter receptor subunit TctC
MSAIRRARLLVAAVAAGLSAVAGAQAPVPFPAKPIRLIVPQAPGGQNDIQARAVGRRLAEALGQPVVVDNRPGAGGQLGFDVAAKAPPDGYTLVLGSISTLAVIPAVQPKLGWHPLKEFAPITLLSSSPYIVVVHPSVPAATLQDLVGLARAKPDQLRYGSSGTATGLHLSTELFNVMVGVKMAHVPYKGAAPATTAILGGEVQVLFNNVIPALPHVKTGRLRALAVTSAKRSPAAPDVPTIAEAGVPGYESGSWQGIAAAGRPPHPVVDRLHREIVAILRAPEIADFLAGQGNEVGANTPAEFERFIAREIAKWARVVRDAGIRVE